MKMRSTSADIIRILAVFFVVFSHSTDRFVLYTTLKGSFAWNVIYYLNTLSRVAVPLFIILSGYLILQKEKTHNIKSFFKRRFSRILLPFIVWLGIYYGWTAYWDQRQLTPDFILQTLWHADLWHLYFLVIILELYLLAPTLVNFMERKNRKNHIILFWSLIAIGIASSLLIIFHIDARRTFITMFIPYIGIFYAGGYLRNFAMTKIRVVFFAAAYFILAY